MIDRCWSNVNETSVGLQGDLARPPITIDMDGVLCQPVLWLNLGISRRIRTEPPPDWPPQVRATVRKARRNLWLLVDWLRYGWRSPLPDAREGLAALREVRTPILLTGRSGILRPLVEGWLRKHHMAEYFDEVQLNEWPVPARQYKLQMVRQRGAREHVDDDGSVAYYLAHHGVPRVYLRDWPLNRNLPYPPNVRVYRRLVEVAEDLARGGAES